MRALVAAFAAAAVLGALGAASEPQVIPFVLSSGVELGTLQLSPARDELFLASPGRTVVVGSCSDERSREIDAPGSPYRAAVVYRNCGVTVDFATHVIVGRGSDRLTVGAFRGRQPLELRWDGAESLSVVLPPLAEADVFRRKTSAYEVSVSYATDDARSAAEPSPYLGVSSFNFGATGRAAGMPSELLLRVAGWSQRASGLHRRAWGAWNGDPPYGDDPRGNQDVLDGIRYFETTDAP